MEFQKWIWKTNCLSSVSILHFCRLNHFLLGNFNEIMATENHKLECVRREIKKTRWHLGFFRNARWSAKALVFLTLLGFLTELNMSYHIISYGLSAVRTFVQTKLAPNFLLRNFILIISVKKSEIPHFYGHFVFEQKVIIKFGKLKLLVQSRYFSLAF